MLVLSRQVDESIIIAGDIVITILAIDGDQIKIGISAPQHITIYRNELWQAIHEQEQVLGHLATRSDSDKFEELRQLLVSETPE